MFLLEGTSIYGAVRWRSFLGFKYIGIFKKIFLLFFFVVFLLFLFGFFSETLSLNSLSFLFGLSMVLFTVYLSCFLKEIFFNTKLKNPELKTELAEAANNLESFNLAEFLSFDSALAVLKAKKLAKKAKLPLISSTALFYELLSNNRRFAFVFSRLLFNLSDIRNILKKCLLDLKSSNNPSERLEYSEDFQKTITEALHIAKKKGHSRIEAGDLLASLAKNDLIFRKILMDRDLKAGDVENLCLWLEFLEEKIRQRKRFWEWKNLIRAGSLAKHWSAGYTFYLDKFVIDYSEIVKKQGFPETIGHKKALRSLEIILSGEDVNNCLLVGEPGVGRKSMIMELARKSALGESLPEVNYKRVLQLDLTYLAAQTQSTEEAEAVLTNIFQEAVKAGNVILVIDEFHNFISHSQKAGVIDISGVLTSYLSLPQFQLVAVTTFSGLHRYIEHNPSLLSLFEKVEVPEISPEETLMILERLALGLEQKYKKFISFPALREVVLLADKYSPIPFPKAAMDLLNEVVIYTSSIKEKVILPKHVISIVSGKTEIPIGEIDKKERETLLNLESLIHQRIVNQHEAVREVSTALRRARAEVTVRKGPMGAFLFLGPTGVGKTETSKALAEVYFGCEERMIRLDMSEFQSIGDVSRIIGSAVEEGVLTTQVRENPFSLILLDEIEKAHPNILNLFLQVLDEGFLTDGLGRKVDFKHSIIIATSNAGYKIILKALEEKTEWQKVKKEILSYLFEEGIFRPEFINRFDSVVLFQPLSKENLLDIAELMLRKLKKNLKEKNIDFNITPSLKERIAELGYNPVFGAREMRRVIQEKVENVLAMAILSGETKRGDVVEIEPEEFRLKICS